MQLQHHCIRIAASSSPLSHRSALFVADALTAWAGRQGEADPGPAGAGDAGRQGAGGLGVDAGGGGSGAADREGEAEAAAPAFCRDRGVQAASLSRCVRAAAATIGHLRVQRYLTRALTRPCCWQLAARLAALANLNRTVHLPTYNKLIGEEALRLHAEAQAGAPAARSAGDVEAAG